MERSSEWAARAEGWLERDRALMTDDDGWKRLAAPGDLELWSRRLPDDPNDLFRWRIPALGAPAEVVFEGFVTRLLTYHAEWTREFAGGHVVEEPGPGARVLYQRFEPGIPGISPRDLCSVEVVRGLAPGLLVASFRSVDRLPPERGYERIDWWGAALCRTLPDGQRSELTYLDRENQGGRFPAWLMNRTMPHYLVLQAEQVRRFFANGGPVELSRARAV